MFFGKKQGGAGWLIVGLGNPGREYAESRHNVGFMVVDILCDKLGVKVDKVKFRALTGLTAIGQQKALIMKPQTYMNLSGEAVRAAADFYKVPPEHIIVIYDDISLDVGRLRIRKNGSAGGHNGIKSIISHCGDQFPRIKIGVGAKPHPDWDLAEWVLSGFSASDKNLVLPALENAADAAIELVSAGIDSASNKYSG